MSEVLDTDTTPCPLTAFFGVPHNYPDFTKWKLNVLSFAPLVACRRVLLQGKSPIAQQNALGRMTWWHFWNWKKFNYSWGSTKKFHIAWQPVFSHLLKFLLFRNILFNRVVSSCASEVTFCSWVLHVNCGDNFGFSVDCPVLPLLALLFVRQRWKTGRPHAV